ncbi:unnamed protein product [Hydatigera taeniaeformis]|uniref:Protein-tyrosine-phosphatase n=1 Tax=Hydatigena taeniaeformis TaxID=6205 RepID=A0A0R3X7W8_HYDTA|nr:unnamed protein product [Hydatigera taeniaeformis]
MHCCVGGSRIASYRSGHITCAEYAALSVSQFQHILLLGGRIVLHSLAFYAKRYFERSGFEVICNLKASVIVFLLCLLHGPSSLTLVEAEECFNSWTFPGSHVAVSVKPIFKKTETTLGGRKVVLQWDFDLINRADDTTKIPINDYWGKRYGTKFVANKAFYNGTAKMSINVVDSKLRTERCPFIELQTRSESPTRCRAFRSSPSNAPLNLFVFNRTAQMQVEVGEGQDGFCFDRLSPGTTYHLCVASNDCLNDWNCGTFTTFQETSQNTSLFSMNVYVEGVDSDWIQLSWPPPNVRTPASPPIGYVISVRRYRACWERAVFVSAPWSTEQESVFIRHSAERLASAHSCNARRVSVVEGQVDGYWPDFPGSRRYTWVEGWNRADVDEQGPLGLFAVTMTNLQSNTRYNFDVTPVFYPDLNVPPQSESVEARTASSSSKVSLTQRGTSVEIYKYGAYEVTISEIGAYPMHCNDNVPTFNNGASERLCRTSSHNTWYSVTIPLGSGAVYRIKITSSHPRNIFQKVLRTPPDQLKFQPQIKATVLSSNLINIQVSYLNCTVANPLAFIVRICQTKDYNQCKLHPLYYEVVSSYSFYQNRSVWQVNEMRSSAHLNAHIRPPDDKNVQVSLYAYPGDSFTGEELLLGSTTSESQRYACKNWCIWPAGDWTNTHGRALGTYNRELARRDADGKACEGYCEPLTEAIDGESGCVSRHRQMQLCNIPLCSAVALLGCVTDVDAMQGTSWIDMEWKNPREHLASSSKFLILVTSRYDEEVGQVFVERNYQAVLPPFLRSAVQSLQHQQVTYITDDVRRVNITNLAQNTEYNISIIPYLSNGLIGAVLERTVKTKIAAPCQMAHVRLRRSGGNVTLVWHLDFKRTCSAPEHLVVGINETRRDVKLAYPFNEAYLKHNFEFCRTYLFSLRFESLGGTFTYPHVLSSAIGYPSKNLPKGVLSLRDCFDNVSVPTKTHSS